MTKTKRMDQEEKETVLGKKKVKSSFLFCSFRKSLKGKRINERERKEEKEEKGEKREKERRRM